MGTTWVTKILVSLLYEYDDEGKLRDGSMENRNTIPNRSGQTYPDALYANRDDKDADNEGIFARVPDGRVKVDGIFGDFTFDDLGESTKTHTVHSAIFDATLYMIDQLYCTVAHCYFVIYANNRVSFNSNF